MHTGVDPHSLRAVPRLKIFQPAEMRVGAARYRVHVLDLSADGALVHHASPPFPGTLVALDCAGMTCAARVVRREGQRFGVRFLIRLSDAQLAAAVAAAAPSAPGAQDSAVA